MTTIQISNGRLIDPKSGTDAKKDVFIADGRIVAIGRAPAGFQPGRVIDAAGLVVAPGFVDLSARLREPGFEHKATLESEMQAAVAGGIAHLAIPPDTEPPLDEPGLVQMLKYRARGLHLAHVHPLGALTQGLGGERLTEMVELIEAGCVAFSQANVAISDNEVLWRAMQYASTFAYTVWLRPQDALRAGLAAIADLEEFIILLERAIWIGRIRDLRMAHLHLLAIRSRPHKEGQEPQRTTGKAGKRAHRHRSINVYR